MISSGMVTRSNSRLVARPGTAGTTDLMSKVANATQAITSASAISIATSGKSTIFRHSGFSPDAVVVRSMTPLPSGSCSAEREFRCKRLSGERKLRLRDPVAFGREKLLLVLDPAAVAAERAVAADHAVARDQHRDMVVAVRGADRAHRLRVADRSGDFRIAAGLAGRDLAELAPHRLLECGPRDVDRQVLRGERLLDRLQHSRDEFAEDALVLDDRRVVKQPVERRLTVLERQPANALGRRG